MVHDTYGKLFFHLPSMFDRGPAAYARTIGIEIRAPRADAVHDGHRIRGLAVGGYDFAAGGAAGVDQRFKCIGAQDMVHSRQPVAIAAAGIEAFKAGGDHHGPHREFP
jgi:hypothetical protein